MTDVKVAVRLRGEARHDGVVHAFAKVSRDDVTDEVTALWGG
jgi:hypothetical protein